MTNHQRRILGKMRNTLIAALAGGSLFGACELRIHDAIIGGSKTFLYSLLNPDSLLQVLLPLPPSDTASNTTSGP